VNITVVMISDEELMMHVGIVCDPVCFLCDDNSMQLVSSLSYELVSSNCAVHYLLF